MQANMGRYRLIPPRTEICGGGKTSLSFLLTFVGPYGRVSDGGHVLPLLES